MMPTMEAMGARNSTTRLRNSRRGNRRNRKSCSRRLPGVTTPTPQSQTSVRPSERKGVGVRITIEILMEAERLLLSGLSERKVASRLGICRSTVQNYRKRGFELRERQRDADEEITYFSDFTQIPKRCEKCGWKVRVPCLYCQIQEHRKKKSQPERVYARGKGRIEKRVGESKPSTRIEARPLHDYLQNRQKKNRGNRLVSPVAVFTKINPFNAKEFSLQRGRRDSNPQPLDRQSSTLTN